MITAALAELRAEHALAADGLDRRRNENMASRIAEVEQQFFITLSPTFPYKKDQLFDYVCTTGDCIGPVSGDEISEVIKTLASEWCFYWPCGDPDNDYVSSKKGPTNPIGPGLIEDIRLAIGIESKTPLLEQSSLLLLQGVWRYQRWFLAEHPTLEDLATCDFDSLCQQVESLDKCAELAFSFAPQLRKVPWPPNLRGPFYRALCRFAQYAEQRQWLGMDLSQLQRLGAATTRLQPADENSSQQ
jgi:hypothetical protein